MPPGGQRGERRLSDADRIVAELHGIRHELWFLNEILLAQNQHATAEEKARLTARFAAMKAKLSTAVGKIDVAVDHLDDVGTT